MWFSMNKATSLSWTRFVRKRTTCPVALNITWAGHPTHQKNRRRISLWVYKPVVLRLNLQQLPSGSSPSSVLTCLSLPGLARPSSAGTTAAEQISDTATAGPGRRQPHMRKRFLPPHLQKQISHPSFPLAIDAATQSITSVHLITVWRAWLGVWLSCTTFSFQQNLFSCSNAGW